MELSGLKLSQLRKICQERGYKGYSNLRKPETIELIVKHTGTNAAPEGYEFIPKVKSTGKPNKTSILMKGGLTEETISTMNIDQINDKIEELRLNDMAKKRGVRIKKPKRTRQELETRAKDIGMKYKDSWSDHGSKKVDGITSLIILLK